MDLELLLKKENLNNEIRDLENLQDHAEELKRLRNKLVFVEKQIKLQCQQEGHYFGTKWNCFEEKFNFGKIKLIRETYEKTCDICGTTIKTKKIKFSNKK